MWPSANLSCSKLRQETQVICEEVSYVVDSVAEHSDAFRSHAERKTPVDLRVVARFSQHCGVHHSCAHDFDPSGPFAQPAPVSTALETIDRHLDARLDEGEEVAAEAHLAFRPEDSFGELVERALKFRERDVLIDGKAFDLVELPFVAWRR